MAANIEVPGSPADLTPEWLTGALASRIDGARVTGFDRESIAEGVGFLGELQRLTLRYDREVAGAPGSLIAKFPTANEQNRQLGMLFAFYEREIGFYRDVAPIAAVRTPEAPYAGMDQASGRFVLLLEDLAPARMGDQLKACSAAEAKLAVTELARFHAQWWDDPRIETMGWLPPSNCMANQAVAGLYAQSFPIFEQQARDRIAPRALEAARKLGPKMLELLDAFSKPPRTILHGDYRLDNIFFGTPSGDAPLAVIDWQLLSACRSVYDVAYFLCGSLRPGDRRAHEMEILRSYHRALEEHGVRGYSFDECFSDYRSCALFVQYIPVTSVGGLMDQTNERGVALFDAMVERYCAAADDLRLDELL